MKTEIIIVQLAHVQGPLTGRVQEFSGPVITIGRGPECDMRFPEEITAMSGHHAEIVRERNRFKLLDMSTNGTFVNGRQVKETFLEDGDVIMFSPDGPKVSFLSRIIEPRDIEQDLEVIRPEPMMPVDVPKPPEKSTTRKASRKAVPRKPRRRHT